MKYIASALLGLILMACQKTDVSPDQFTMSYPLADQSLWESFTDFEEEAAERGLIIDLTELQITARIQEIAQDHVAGQCSYSSASPNSITIDREFWSEASRLSREMVVFHELGHCVLLRQHIEATSADGFCLSIMRSGIGNCRDAYSVENREYYLDELFSSMNELAI